VSGLLLGIFGTKKYWENEYKLRAEEEIASVKAAYRREKDRTDDDDKPKVKVQDLSERVSPVPPVAVNLYRGTDDEEIVDYGSYYASEGENNTSQVRIMEDFAEKEHPREDEPPFLISKEEFDETYPHFDKMSCTFYVPNMTVVDDISREVVDSALIGEENLQYMVEMDENFAYIRNEQISCDMEISRELCSIEELDAPVYFG